MSDISQTAAAPQRRWRLPDRYVVGLIVFFAALFTADGLLLYLALNDNPPQIEESYEARVGEAHR